MKLYNSQSGMSPARLRVYLAEKGLTLPCVDLDFSKGEHKSPEYLKINSLGLVPALQLDDSRVITETMAICRYLEELHPAPPLFGHDIVERALVEMWSRRIELEILIPASEILQHSSDVFKDRVRQVPAFAEAMRITLAERLHWLEGEMADGRLYFVGDNFTIADITGVTAFRITAYAGIDVSDELPHLRDWIKRMRARSAFDYDHL